MNPFFLLLLALGSVLEISSSTRSGNSAGKSASKDDQDDQADEVLKAVPQSDEDEGAVAGSKGSLEDTKNEVASTSESDDSTDKKAADTADKTTGTTKTIKIVRDEPAGKADEPSPSSIGTPESDDTPTPGPVSPVSDYEPPDVDQNEPDIPEQDTTVTATNGTLDAMSGRVTTVDLGEDDIASVRILSGPDEGNLTVNPDNTLALVLTETKFVGQLDFKAEVTHADGSIEIVNTTVNVSEGLIEKGWAKGEFYELETNDSGNSVIEWGDNHRDIYVSGSNDALSLADIADREGLDVSKIDGAWLRGHPEYGSTEDMALAEDAGVKLWTTLVRDSAKEPASHWLRLESDYEYTFDNLLRAGITGESPLHPIHITSYGDGAKPILTEMPEVFGDGAKNVVFSDVELTEGVRLIAGENIMFENISSTGDDLIVQNIDGFTLRNSAIYDVQHDESLTDDLWEPAANRISGIYSANTHGLLIENTLFDHNGWGEGYDINMSLDSAQPPSIYSHNVYIQTNSSDITFRDNITMRGASFGAQFRPGAFVEDNVFLDNNAAVFVSGGKDKNNDEFAGNYSIFSGNVVTSAGDRDYGGPNGQLAGGIGDYAPLTSWVDNIVAHLADPDDPDDLASKTRTESAIQGGTDAYHNDTIVYNWAGAGKDPDSQNQNTDGLDTSILDATTIQNFAARLLGDDKGTIPDLAEYLRTSAEGEFSGVSDSELIIQFFQAGFGITPDGRLAADTIRFIPNDLGDGIRWDNRMNWSTEDLPGSVSGDSVDLGGNWVHFGGTTELKDLDFGDGGRLTATHGRLDVTGDVETDGEGGEIHLDNAGQVWIDGYSDSDDLEIDVEGGRFANTGDVDGSVDVTVSDGQAILATDGGSFDVNDGSKIEIIGDDAKVGFEGIADDTAVLRLAEDGVLRFKAEDGDIGKISEFRSGAQANAALDVQSGVNLGEGTLKLDLNDLDPGEKEITLISVDEIVGAFSVIDVKGLSDDRDAELVFDYENDSVSLSVGKDGQGSGDFDISVLGNQMDAQSSSELWDALTDGQPVLDDQLPNTLIIDGEEEVVDLF